MFVCVVDDMRAVTPNVDLGGAASLLCGPTSDRKARRISQNVYSCGVPNVSHRHEEKTLACRNPIHPLGFQNPRCNRGNLPTQILIGFPLWDCQTREAVALSERPYGFNTVSYVGQEVEVCPRPQPGIAQRRQRTDDLYIRDYGWNTVVREHEEAGFLIIVPALMSGDGILCLQQFLFCAERAVTFSNCRGPRIVSLLLQKFDTSRNAGLIAVFADHLDLG